MVLRFTLTPVVHSEFIPGKGVKSVWVLFRFACGRPAVPSPFVEKASLCPRRLPLCLRCCTSFLVYGFAHPTEQSSGTSEVSNNSAQS